MERTLTLKALCESISAATGEKIASLKVQITRWRSEHSEFPCDRVKGDPRFNLDEVRTWMAQRPKRREPAPAAAAPVTPAVPARVVDENDPLIQKLMSGDSSPLSIARSALQLSARQVGDQARTGAIGAGTLDALKKQLEELRRSEEAYMDLAKRRAELIERTTACAVAGDMANRLVKCLDRVINDLSVQIEIWLADASFEALNIEQRGRAVREWIERSAAEVRRVEAEDIDKLIEAHRIDEIAEAAL